MSLDHDSSDTASPTSQDVASFMDSLLDGKNDEFHFSTNGVFRFKEVNVAQLIRGRSLTDPKLQLLLKVDQGHAAGVVLQRVLGAKLNELWKHLRLERDSLADSDNALLRNIAEQLIDGMGSLRLRQVQGLVRALQKSGRASLSESGVVVGRRHVYAPAAITDRAVAIRYALLAVFRGNDTAVSWKPSPVLLLDPSGGVAHLSAGDLERLGYERLQGRAVRVDIVERLLDPRFVQKQPVYLPTLMHTLRCDEEEAHAVARLLGLAGASKGSSPRRGSNPPRGSSPGKGKASRKSSSARKG